MTQDTTERIQKRIEGLLYDERTKLSDGIIIGYLSSMKRTLARRDLVAYGKILEMLSIYETDYGVNLPWKRELEL